MTSTVDFIGVGVGPFNLSIAALSQQAAGFTSLFLDSRPRFAWHPGMLVPDCAMQTMFLKDLVTAVAPCSPYSFVNYLVQRRKFYRFLTTGMRVVSRHEFSDYLSWAAEGMENLRFGQTVQEITFDDDRRLFAVRTQDDLYHSRHVCLGVGKEPFLPSCVPDQDDRCFHASEMNARNPDLGARRVTIVGGGQSGADLFLNVLRGEWGDPTHIHWVSRRNNFNALDETPFANEYFTPEYVQSFGSLSGPARQQMLTEQKMTSDGITTDTLSTIYRTLYHRFEVQGRPLDVGLLPSRSVTSVTRHGEGIRLHLDHQLDQGHDLIDTDVVILATGYRWAVPAFLSPLLPRLSAGHGRNLHVRDDFTLGWDGPPDNLLFAVNASIDTHGIAEPQLSLMAWRSARILNRALGRDLFDLSTTPSFIRWRSARQDSLS
ncbi:lysine N(6)-hydroxylase/L-ornithine N(5)-oxygenase family protein [Micromonospora sp. HUAS LYJ1]|uniref:lysine N(6)-hydroxylase/L-ornithine N(5)-oxygenase family protein n=1 Tax=Micromonospora sp. HUAS LYJ1 TaxID=3061626 RepID=UPI0026737FC6|nr:SidA/IucD/PvdA family monooxygenase [Micromonospora sp. HUAS LYJ1]WKU07144.1 SidA/IucD/PvdA family monooxygenase [Micromonospora sp. HUAS LYJ1]